MFGGKTDSRKPVEGGCCEEESNLTIWFSLEQTEWTVVPSTEMKMTEKQAP